MRGPTVSVRSCRRSVSDELRSVRGRALHHERVPGAHLACIASLWGPPVEELSAEELDVADPHFPLVACAYTEKAR